MLGWTLSIQPTR